MKHRYAIIIWLLASCASPIFAQSDTTGNPVESLIEIYQEQNAGEDAVGDFNTQFEYLDDLRRKPLNINEATRTDLEGLQLLSPLQVEALLSYRDLVGDLLEMYELQAVPGFDVPTIRRILPFTSVGETGDRTPIAQMFWKGRDDILMRYNRRLERAEGYDPERANGYLGDRNKVYVRYRHTFNDNLSYGLTAEKDAGEPFGGAYNPQGFDFYSAHLFGKNLTKNVKAVALGDFGVTLGQGLLMNTGFGAGKSANVTSIRRQGTTFRPFTSVNEANFMRGAAVTLTFAKTLEVSLFASSRRRDANTIITIDTTAEIPAELLVSSVQTSGLHRTINEIADKNAIGQITAGGRVQYTMRRGQIGINTLYNQFDTPISLPEKPYNKYYFRGSKLLASSADYAWHWRNVYLFGEVAADDSLAVAQQHGALVSLYRTVVFSAMFRDLSPKYRSIFATPFAETTQGSNERGLYMGLEMHPTPLITLAGYFDAWQHPWLRFTANAPSNGHEVLGRITYTRRKKWDTYIQFRRVVREANTSLTDLFPRTLAPSYRTQLRIHFNQTISKQLSISTRIEAGSYQFTNRPIERSFLIYQDFSYKIVPLPITLECRLSLFDTDSYNSRIYAFERDIQLSFSAPPLYGRGARYYAMWKWRMSQNITLEGRIAQTFYANQTTVGSGLELRNTNKTTDFGLQLRMSF